MPHSVIPPSSAHIWGKKGGCPGWVKVNNEFPDKGSSESAMDGTACHAIAETLINGGVAPKVGEIVDGRTVTEEMIEAARLFAGVCLSSLPGAKWETERKVHASQIHPESFGTVDFYAYNGTEIFIADLKFGYKIVEVFENMQLVNYYAGIIEYLSVWENLKVTFCIVQPRQWHRDGPVRTWTTTYEKLSPYVQELKECAEIAVSGNAPVRSGDHCRYCKARHCCPAALEAGLSMYEITTGSVPNGLTANELGLYLQVIQRAQRQLEYVAVGVEEELRDRLENGEIAGGYTLQPTRGRETWKESPEKILEMGDFLGVDLRKPDVITPNQARKLGVSNEVLSQFAERKASLNLKYDDGSRARHIFGV